MGSPHPAGGTRRSPPLPAPHWLFLPSASLLPSGRRASLDAAVVYGGIFNPSWLRNHSAPWIFWGVAGWRGLQERGNLGTVCRDRFALQLCLRRREKPLLPWHRDCWLPALGAEALPCPVHVLVVHTRVQGVGRGVWGAPRVTWLPSCPGWPPWSEMSLSFPDNPHRVPWPPHAGAPNFCWYIASSETLLDRQTPFPSGCHSPPAPPLFLSTIREEGTPPCPPSCPTPSPQVPPSRPAAQTHRCVGPQCPASSPLGRPRPRQTPERAGGAGGRG